METEKQNVLSDATKMIKQVDKNLILNLLKNPLESLALTEKQFVYGILGLASSFVGFLIWGFILGKKVASLFSGLFMLGGLFGKVPISLTSEVFGRVFKLGLLSTVVLLISVWLVSWWRSGIKPSFKLFVTQVGAIHFIGAVGFLLASILFFNLQLSLVVLLITVFSLLGLSLYAGQVSGGVTKEKIASYIVLSIASYVLIMAIFSKLVL